jgi:hypothetical protein
MTVSPMAFPERQEPPMESLTGIVMALATGAAAALKPTAEQAIKDGYKPRHNIVYFCGE